MAMLTRNISVQFRLVNGTIGKIISFVKEDEGEDLDMIDYVIVCFENYTGNSTIDENDGKLVPIKRLPATNGCLNFPLVSASSLTIHKSQGSTFDFRISVDIGERETMGSTFVAFSRVKRFEDLVVKPFDFDRYLLIGEGKYVSDREEAFAKLDEIEFRWIE